jgi:hypothetical protein
MAIGGCAKDHHDYSHALYTVMVADPAGYATALADEKECGARGLQPGTSAYTDCRLALVAKRRAAASPN